MQNRSLLQLHLGSVESSCYQIREDHGNEGGKNMRLERIFPGKLLFIAAMLAFALAPAYAKGNKGPKPVTVKLQDGQGKSVGAAVLSGAPQGIKIKLNVHDLTAGEHAIHVHQTAKCDAPDFKTAGAHFNPDGKKHGLENPDGPHAGDIPNFTVDAKGKSRATLTASNVTLGDDPRSVFTGGGTALVIHAKPDDNKTDPSGNSGDRIACGVITK